MVQWLRLSARDQVITKNVGLNSGLTKKQDEVEGPLAGRN